MLDAKRFLLGVAGQPEWQEFERATPHGPQLELTFAAEANPAQATLVQRAAGDPARLQSLLTGYDQAVRVQAADVLAAGKR